MSKGKKNGRQRKKGHNLRGGLLGRLPLGEQTAEGTGKYGKKKKLPKIGERRAKKETRDGGGGKTPERKEKEGGKKVTR